MPERDIDKRLERQEDRNVKKTVKKQMKGFKEGQGVRTEAKEQGVDLDALPPYPLTSEAKQRITEGITTGARDALKEKVAGFAKAYADPSLTRRPALDEDALKRSRRSEKREKIFDVLRGIGAAFQGKDVQSSLLAPKLAKERQGQYQQYKDVVEANKAKQEQWEHMYRKDLINFLEAERSKLTGDSELDNLKKKEIEAKINKLKSEAEASRALAKQRLRRKPTGKDSELSPTFTYKNEAGEVIKIPMKGKENLLLEYKAKQRDSNRAKEERDGLVQEMEEKISQIDNFWGIGEKGDEEDIRREYEPLIRESENKMKLLQDDLDKAEQRLRLPESNNTKTNQNKLTEEDWEV